MTEIAKRKENKITKTEASQIINQAIDQYTSMVQQNVFDVPDNYSCLLYTSPSPRD